MWPDMLFDRQPKRLKKTVGPPSENGAGPEITQMDEVESYLHKLNKFTLAQNSWISRGPGRREKKRRRMIVYVENDRRDPDSKRRDQARRVAPEKDPDPAEAFIVPNPANTPAPPEPPKSGFRVWMDDKSQNLRSLFGKRR